MSADGSATVLTVGLAGSNGAPLGRLAVAGRRTHVTPRELAAFEGLVGKTTLIWAERCQMEPDDFRQEMWLRVTKGLLHYDSTRSKMSEENYVFSLMFNRVKDFLRRPDVKHPGRTVSLEVAGRVSCDGDELSSDHFEAQNCSIEREDVREVLAAFLPPGLSSLEVQVAAMLAMGYQHEEIVAVLGCSYRRVKATARVLRVALGDQRPRPRDPGVRRLACA